MKIRKNDIFLIVAILLLAGAVWFRLFLIKKEGAEVAVIQNGEVTATYPLSEKLRVVIPSADGGENVLVISGGAACIERADCPDKTCVKQGEICYDGETVVCLPHRLVIEITGGDAGEFDSVAG